MKNIESLIKILDSFSGPTLVGIKGYTNAKGQEQNILAIVNANINKIKERDQKKLKKLDLNNFTEYGLSISVLEQARSEILNSLAEPNEIYSKAQNSAYKHIGHSIKRSINTSSTILYGYKLKSTLKIEQDFKNDLSKAKYILNSLITSSKYRLYKLDQIKEIKINKLTLN